MKKLQRLAAVPTIELLRKGNGWLAALYGIQGVAILLLATTKTVPISASYLAMDSLQSTTSGSVVLAPATHHVFDLNLAYLVATFLVLAAVAHLSMATWYRLRYETDLAEAKNRMRWLEYALSGSTMLAGIAVLAGMYDVVSLGFVFVLGALMSLCGLVMEAHNPLKKRGLVVNWKSYIVGCIAGAVAWLGIAAYLVFTNVFGAGHVPTFVYWIYATVFILFGGFAANMYLQYKKIGPWQYYLYGERCYMVLGLVAKTLLAWQIFAGALRP